MKTKPSQGLLIILILLTNVIPPFGIDEFTPSMPHMLSVFGVSASLMQLTITVYLLAFAISQIIGGIFSDRYGRRNPLLLSMPLFLIGSVIAIFAVDINTLLIGRAIQGLGVGVSSLTGPAMMADCFEGNELNRVSGYYSTVYSFIPISAPILGGFIQEYVGWQANFVLMLILAAVIYCLFWIKLPETHTPNPSHKLTLKNIYRSYASVLTNKKYMLSVCCLMLVWSTFMVFSVMAPFIMQNTLKLSPSIYGLLALLVGLGFFAGALVNNALVKRLSVNTILQLGIITMIVLSFIMLALPTQGIFNPISVMAPIFLFMVAAGFSFPHLYAKAVSAVTQYAGVAGALIGSLILLGAVIITAILTQLHAHSIIAMSAAYLILSGLCFTTNLMNK